MSRFATFKVTFDGFEYTPDDYDHLVLATAIYGETRGSHSQAEWVRMAWTWMNRFILKTGRPWSSFANLILNHSQPVNPKWRSNGTFCKPGGKYHGNTTYCSSSQLSWRDKMAGIINGAKWSSIPSDIVDVATKFVNGQLPEPESDDGSPIVDFANNKVAQNNGTRYESGGNYFLSYYQVQKTNLTRSFINEHVVVLGGTPSGEYNMPSWLKVGIGAWLLATAYAAYRLFLGGGK